MDIEKLLNLFQITGSQLYGFMKEAPGFYTHPLKTFRNFFLKQEVDKVKQIAFYLVLAALSIIIFFSITKEDSIKIILLELLASVVVFLFVGLGDVLISKIFKLSGQYFNIYLFLVLVKLFYSPVCLIFLIIYIETESLDFLLLFNSVLALLFLIVWILPAFVFYNKLKFRIAWILITNLTLSIYLLTVYLILEKGLIDKGIGDKLDEVTDPISYEMDIVTNDLFDSSYFPYGRVLVKYKPVYKYFIVDYSHTESLPHFFTNTHENLNEPDSSSSEDYSSKLIENIKDRLRLRENIQKKLHFSKSKEVNEFAIHALKVTLKEVYVKQPLIDSSTYHFLSDSCYRAVELYDTARSNYILKAYRAFIPVIWMSYLFPVILLIIVIDSEE